MDVPGYVEASEVGRGGFATVYSARSEADGSTVALKVFRTEEVDGRRVSRELAALERLSGIPNIVPVLGVTTATDGSPVLVMPYLPSTMAERIESGGVPPEQAVAWLTQIATALDQAALAGVHHRDIKPGNVLLDDEGHAQLADFGISTLGELDTGTTTASAFSPPYAAPERLEGRTDIDPYRSDIYSLAATTWAAIQGGAPFGTATTGGVSGLIHRVMGGQLDCPTSMPAALYDALRIGMSLDPTDRYATGSALSGAARAALDAPDDLTVVKAWAGAAPVLAGAAASSAGAEAVGAITGDGVGSASLEGDGRDSTESDRSEDPSMGEAPGAGGTRRALAIAAACLLIVVGAVSALVLNSGSEEVITAARTSGERPATSEVDPESTQPTVGEATPEAVVEGATLIPPLIVSPPESGGEPAPVADGSAAQPPARVGSSGTSIGAPAPAPAAPVPAPAPTPTPVVSVPTSCTIVDGRTSLTPGIAWGEVGPQTATMVAPLTCQLSRGGVLNGTLMMVDVYFPSLGFTGGQTSGSGAINWSDGRSTQVNGQVTVIPTADNDGWDVVLALVFASGYGSPASGTTSKLRVQAVFDEATQRVISIDGMSGQLPWTPR